MCTGFFSVKSVGLVLNARESWHDVSSLHACALSVLRVWMGTTF